MVDPALLIALPLGVAFLLPLAHRIDFSVARILHLATLAFSLALAAFWLRELGLFSQNAVDIETGGWAPPWGILLRLGGPEAALIALADAVAIAAAIYLAPRDRENGGVRGLMIQLMIVLGAHGLILTRDLFNMFVFLEITSIGTYAVVLYGKEGPALEAGLKYLLIGAIASVFILLATGILYRLTGTLYIDDMAGRIGGLSMSAVFAVQILMLVGFLAELKLFPVNGPAIDLYEGADPGAMALIVGTALNAMFFAFTKVFTLFQSADLHTMVMAVGMVTFVVSNLLATKQTKVRRILGYSSSAQMGLLVFLWPLVDTHPALFAAVVLLLLNHTVAKAGLLWLAGAHGGENVDDWRGSFKNRPFMGIAFIVLVLSIAGLPPFPGFWGKWEALLVLARDSEYCWWIAPLLVGAFLEWVYYFGWAKRLFMVREEKARQTGASSVPLVAAAASVVFGLGILYNTFIAQALDLAPAAALLVAGAILLMLRDLPWRIQGAISLIVIAGVAASLFVVPAPDHALSALFLGLIVTGALIVGFAALAYKTGSGNYWGIFTILTASLIFLVQSVGTEREQSLLLFFLAWEIMTWTSWLLMGNGRKSAQAGYVYMLFSGAGGMMILAGLMVAEGVNAAPLAKLAALSGTPALAAWTLIVGGLAVKLGSWGVHIWARDAYAESPDSFTPFLSAVVSKAPIFALIVLVANVKVGVIETTLGTIDPMHLLAWVGGVTAFGMALLAALQEDAKRLLAYSSVGQVAYIVVGFAIATPLGWAAALYLTINHFLFKALLFIAVAGVVYRTGTRTFYELGGLIKRMPFSFVSLLIGIIAVSGVPPLSGFVGKWLIYEALIDRGWLLLTGLLMFATMIAFLYLYRLVHSIFLGQMKTVHRTVREAPWPMVAAQGVLLALIMVLSVWPQVVMEPIAAILGTSDYAFAGTGALTFADGGTMLTPMGYTNPMITMTIVGVLFGLLLAVLLVISPWPKWVRQGDMVYSAEVPPPAEETHYAYAMFKPYERAFAPVLAPRVIRFWNGAAETLSAVTETGRRFYTGNAQTYLLYAVGMIVLLAYLAGS
ncbi:MAG: hypothetical protein HN403_05360 [Rhodospirillales bacterium]|jgi:formate hydrogenlyase subunit 3/multisubunit Na+/H+ antiporter MnhD subunit|nr:hypothetical protein [Rhodospirillales bacterium]